MNIHVLTLRVDFFSKQNFRAEFLVGENIMHTRFGFHTFFPCFRSALIYRIYVRVCLCFGKKLMRRIPNQFVNDYVRYKRALAQNMSHPHHSLDTNFSMESTIMLAFRRMLSDIHIPLGCWVMFNDNGIVSNAVVAVAHFFYSFVYGTMRYMIAAHMVRSARSQLVILIHNTLFIVLLC